MPVRPVPAPVPPPEPVVQPGPPKSDFITLGCPSCGGNLQITKDTDRFACKYCSREHLVRRENGIFTVTPVLEKLDRIVSGVDRQASELAIPRLKRVCRNIEDRIEDEWQYIDRAKNWASRKSGSATTGAVMLGTLGLLFSACGAAVHWGVAVICVIVTVGLCALYVRFSQPDLARVERNIRRTHDRIDDLEVTLIRRRRELGKHYDNVRI